MKQFQDDQVRLQEEAAQRELDAWQEGRSLSRQRGSAGRERREIQEAKARLPEWRGEEAYMKQMRKKSGNAANGAQLWAQQNRAGKREQQLMKEREEDEVRMKLYAEMLEKEHRDQ